jgi:hypothetical protein
MAENIVLQSRFPSMRILVPRARVRRALGTRMEHAILGKKALG